MTELWATVSSWCAEQPAAWQRTSLVAARAVLVVHAAYSGRLMASSGRRVRGCVVVARGDGELGLAGYRGYCVGRLVFDSSSAGVPCHPLA